MFISMKKRASNRDGHEWKSPDMDRVISTLHECWKPLGFCFGDSSRTESGFR
jgi:hypothetical protein